MFQNLGAWTLCVPAAPAHGHPKSGTLWAKYLQDQRKDTLLRTSPSSLGRDTLGLGTPGTLWGWALRGHSGVGHETLGLGTPEKTLGLGTPGTPCGWALQEDSGVGHSRETLGWDLGWARVGHSREILGLGTLERLCGWAGTPGRLWGWALQRHSRVAHSKGTLGLGLQRCARSRPGELKSSRRGEEFRARRTDEFDI